MHLVHRWELESPLKRINGITLICMHVRAHGWEPKMKIVYATGNPGKFGMMKEFLEGMEMELVSLSELGRSLKEPEECGKFPLENARQKAAYYFNILRQPVFSCDSALFIEGLPAEEQPGVHVRNRDGKRMTDSEMTEYYAGIAKRFGGKCIARYQNAICLILDGGRRYEYDGEDISGGRFYLVDAPVEQKEEGFPLDCISVDMESGTYFTQREEISGIGEEKAGFRRFFEGIWREIEDSTILI